MEAGVGQDVDSAVVGFEVVDGFAVEQGPEVFAEEFNGIKGSEGAGFVGGEAVGGAGGLVGGFLVGGFVGVREKGCFSCWAAVRKRVAQGEGDVEVDCWC